LYTEGKPQVPEVPDEKYVLIIGNEHNGFTFTDLAKKIESLEFNLKTVTVPYFEASLEMVNSLKNKPVAIVLSGNNADYPNLPMFEHNGEFEIIRKSEIPILGICAGHQFLGMAYGYTRARSMGWSDISAMEPVRKMTKIDILKDDPLFSGVKDFFIGPEIHSWAVAEPFEEFIIIAKSSYVQAQKSTKRLVYGIQFHAEINENYNEGKKILSNFFKLALERKVK
jgi:anthranilate/para-aminobenzoate synthase component II